MTSIQAINAPAFTSRPQKQENQYTGLKIGLGAAAISAASYKTIEPMTKFAANLTRKNIENIKSHPEIYTNAEKLIEKSYQNMSQMFKYTKAVKKAGIWKTFAKVAPVIVGVGLITDLGNNFLRRNKEPDAYTEKGNAYTKVDIGKKTGFVNGVIAEILMMKFLGNTYKAMGATPAQKVVTALIGGIGGHILGSIADKMANKKAAEAADKAAA